MNRFMEELIGRVYKKPQVEIMSEEEFQKEMEEELATYHTKKNKERREKIALHVLSQLVWSSVNEDSSHVKRSFEVADEFIRQADYKGPEIVAPREEQLDILGDLY